MSLPDEAFRQVERFCEERVPEDARAQMRLEASARGAKITIIECHVPWNQELVEDWTNQPIAELRYDGTTATWSLYWPRATGRWHRYEGVEAASDVAPLLAEIDADPDGVFWG
jgi:hypothetical protein